MPMKNLLSKYMSALPEKVKKSLMWDRDVERLGLGYSCGKANFTRGVGVDGHSDWQESCPTIEVRTQHNLFPMFSGLSLDDRLLAETYASEARFFWRFLEPLLISCSPARVIEVGGGIGLLSLFASSAVQSMTSLEPESSGFGKMSTFRKTILDFWGEGPLPQFKTALIQELPKDETFDFIYCINVLEHVPEPETLISEAYKRLSPGGTAWYVLPNYSFPYEQHFEIPIIINKLITGGVFRKKIRNHALFPDSEGLWSELSWPTQGGLKKFLGTAGIPHQFRNTVLGGYFDRLDEPEFLVRKGSAYRLLRPLIKLLRPLILGLPYRLQPIIEFTISKPCTKEPFDRTAP